jgi:hypothetical protein
MKTLPISIELSNIASESVIAPLPRRELLDKLVSTLDRFTNILGYCQGSREVQKNLGDDLRLDEYQFDYERHSIRFQLIKFLPRGEWQVQGFQLD